MSVLVLVGGPPQVGAAVCINDLNDPHQQSFLRGHDDSISCLTLSKTGRLLASGQKGRNSDVCVWDFNSRTLKFRSGGRIISIEEDLKVIC